MREIYTLDQNYFRSAELKQLIRDRPTVKFVIPDVALLEMCKGPRWRETMKGSLEALLPSPGRVSVSLSLGVAFAKECADLKSIEGKMVDKEFTKVLRLAMNDLKTDVDSHNGLGLIAAHVEGVQLELQEHELNHENNKRKFLARDTLLREVLGSRASKELRQGASNEHRLAAIHNMSVECATVFLRNRGVSDARIKGFLRTKPLVLRYFLSCFWHNMEWVSNGGITTRVDTRITNDMLDQDYAIVASFFGKLLTKDTPVAKAYADMSQLLRM
ncbi:hypothetical protein [Pseudomonas tremae]|uniref:hypothetical protein n=1 Tax=Pseudomonas tremae TaxID=200454 RepID=UPI000465C1AC|nr:hypothetical protein [Pseudomonas tremae]